MRTVAEFSLRSEPGNERLAAERVNSALSSHLDQRQLERLGTAVSEATLNAMEHGNHFLPDREVRVCVEADDSDVRVSITDYGGGPTVGQQTPDLDKKLAGEQSPRGWGLFLMREMVDGVSDDVRAGRHTVHLTVHLKPGQVAR
jgi:anti-sigma regulatory factor (Ser/Thr protein kinase)